MGWRRGGALLQDVSAAPDPMRDLEALYTRHHRLVRWIVRGCGVPERSVDDAVQDVFVAIHRRRDAAPSEGLERWIVGVARSVCHAHRRAEARRQARVARIEAPAPAPSIEEVAGDRQALRRVHHVLEAIEPAQREAWLLVELEGMSAPEVAEALQANVNTIYSRVRLARRRIEGAFRDSSELVAQARREGRADPEAQRRAWSAIAAEIALPAAAGPGAGAAMVGASATGVATVGWIGWVGGMSVGASAAAAVLGAIVWARAPEPARPPGQAPPAAVASAPADRDGVVALAEPGHEDAPAEDSVAEVAPEPEVAAEPEVAPPGSGTPPAPQARSPRVPPRRGVPEPARPPEPPSALAREAALLRDAARSIDAGELTEGERLLGAHARDYPGGALKAERERLEQQLRRLGNRG